MSSHEVAGGDLEMTFNVLDMHKAFLSTHIMPKTVIENKKQCERLPFLSDKKKKKKIQSKTLISFSSYDVVVTNE